MKYGFSKKLILVIILISLFCNGVKATGIFDNDGSAFITKSEFDALKSSFQNQINEYNQNIDSKIDSAIASYLSGITITAGGDYDPVDIENYDTIQWRDKLIIKTKTRTFTSETAYTDTASAVSWEATYDTFMQADNGDVAVGAKDKPVKLVWSTFAPNGYGGIEVIFKAEMPQKATDGKRYWIAMRNNSGDKAYWQPTTPLVYYSYDEFNKNDKKNVQRLKGWIEYQPAFTGVTSGEADTSKSPVTNDVYQTGYSWATNMNTLKGIRYAKAGTSGRDSNCFGILFYNNAAMTSSVGGIRPTKASTEYFPMWDSLYNANTIACPYLADGDSFPKTYPIGIGYQNTNIDESNEYLCKMMCGSENTQEVNYIVNSTALAFWTCKILWPEDCFKTFKINNFKMRKMPIYGSPGTDWANGRDATSAKLAIDTVFQTAYDGVFKFDTVPTELEVSMPTKPHKKLKLLDTNFFSVDGNTRLRFGDGLPVIKKNYYDCTVTMDFDVTASSGYSTTTYTPYIQLMNSDFNSAGEYIDVTSNTNLGSHKFKINVGHNKIKFNLKKSDRDVWARISPGDNSGENYLNIKNVTASYESLE